MAFLHSLVLFDHWLFARINQDWTNDFFDWLFPQITDLHRDPRALIVVLPLLTFWIWKKKSYALKCLLAIVLAVALADSVAYRAIKGFVQRPRPPDAGITVVVRIPRHAGFSFPSNHASNMFAVATLLSLSIPPGAPIFLLVALLISYSRIYVGVHFPLDVFGGALLGTVIALAVWFALRKWIRRSRDQIVL